MSLDITVVKLPESRYPLKAPHAMDPIGVTEHETGNIASAMAEISYMQGNGNQTSFHFAADHLRIVQGLPLDRNGWHSGDGGQGRGNRRTIAVETCYNWNGRTTTENDPVNNPKYQGAVENSIELIANLFIQYPHWGPPESGKNLFQHNHHNGKNCPQRLRQEQRWAWFVGRVLARYNELKNGGARIHTVSPGDSLWAIGNKYKVSVADLKKWNNLTGDIIRPGQKLNVAGAAATPAPAPIPAPAPKPAAPTVQRLAEDGSWGPATTRRLQQHFGTPVTGQITQGGPSALIRAMQRFYGSPQTGQVTQNGRSSLYEAMQRYHGTPVTGQISATGSTLVRVIQRQLNAGTYPRRG